MFSTNVDFMPLVMMLISVVGIPLGTFFAKQGIAEAAKLLAPYLGEKTAALFQQRVNELLDKAIGEASITYLPQLQAHGLTVDVGNVLAARALDYAVSHAPDLADKAKAFEGGLEEKIRARLLTHPAVATAVMSGAPAAAAQPLAAAA